MKLVTEVQTEAHFEAAILEEVGDENRQKIANSKAVLIANCAVFPATVVSGFDVEVHAKGVLFLYQSFAYEGFQSN